jgi:hypothetical protein
MPIMFQLSNSHTYYNSNDCLRNWPGHFDSISEQQEILPGSWEPDNIVGIVWYRMTMNLFLCYVFLTVT